jgi:hypothetical protein
MSALSAPVSPWIFTQLSGPKKTLTLSGNDAPHGRPRQKPIVKDKITMRQHTVYYSGYGPPTRHIFGPKYEPWELTGRFMDRGGGGVDAVRSGMGYARNKVEFVRGFVADGQDVSICWGEHLLVTGFIDSFEAAIESRGEIAWTMSISVDEDVNLDAKKKTTGEWVARNPKDCLAELELLLTKALIPSIKQPPLFKGSLFDALDSAISLVTAPFALLAQVAMQMDSFERSLIGEIRRFRTGIHQLQTALIMFRNTYQDLRANLATEGKNISSELSFSKIQADSAAATLKALAVLIDADKAAARAERGKMKGYYVVKDGDTWEGISMYLYQSTDRIDDLMTANGVAPGQAPIAGSVYQVPR